MLGNSPTNLNMNSMMDQQKLDRMDPMQNQQCRVCGEPAAGFHFGAFTCEGCKSFFGRTCNNQSVIQECKNNYRCVVDKKNRTACKACRLRKCLMVGMSKSGSRYGRRSNWFKIHCLMQQSPPSSQAQESASVVPNYAWPQKRDDSSSENRDSSFGSNSRSPSPLNTSFDSSKKSFRISEPMKLEPSEPLKPRAPSPVKPIHPTNSLRSPDPSITSSYFPPSSPLASLYSGAFSNPLSMAMSGGGFPFYKLSPLLAAQNPLLAHPFFSSPLRSQLEILAEHRDLLTKFGYNTPQFSANSYQSPPLNIEEPEEEDCRPVSPPTSRSIPIQSDSPIDLSVKISTTSDRSFPSTTLHTLTHSSPLSPHSSASSRDDEGIEVDMAEKSDRNRNLLGASNFEERRDTAVLDLTVSS